MSALNFEERYKWYHLANNDDKLQYIFDLTLSIKNEIKEINNELSTLKVEFLKSIEEKTNSDNSQFEKIHKLLKYLNDLNRAVIKNNTIINEVNSGTELSNLFIDDLSKVFKEDLDKIDKEEKS